MASVQVLGLKELGARMRKLSEKVNNKIAGRATSAGASLIKKQYKTNLFTNPSVDSGLVEKNVIIKKLRKSQTQYTSEHIVTVKKRQYPDHKANTRQVAGFLEFGTVKQPAEPALRPAFEQEKGFAVARIKQVLADGITKAGA